MDIVIKCPNCNKGYRFKDTDDAKTLFSNKINLDPKINCNCGNIYAWNQTEHTFQWTI